MPKNQINSAMHFNLIIFLPLQIRNYNEIDFSQAKCWCDFIHCDCLRYLNKPIGQYDETCMMIIQNQSLVVLLMLLYKTNYTLLHKSLHLTEIKECRKKHKSSPWEMECRNMKQNKMFTSDKHFMELPNWNLKQK